MAIVAVQTFAQHALDGLTSPQLEPATALLVPPAVSDSTTPLIYVWGAKTTEKRETLGRAFGSLAPSGTKDLRLTIDIWPMVAMANDNPDEDTAFPYLLDAIAAKLRGLTIGGELTDPLTGEVVILRAIGEDISIDYSTPVSLADQRLYLYAALVSTAVDVKLVG